MGQKNLKLLVEYYNRYSIPSTLSVANAVIGNMPKEVAFEKVKPSVATLTTLLEILNNSIAEAKTRSRQAIAAQHVCLTNVQLQLNEISKVANEIVGDNATLAALSGLTLNHTSHRKGILNPLKTFKAFYDAANNVINITWVLPKGARGCEVRWKKMNSNDFQSKTIIGKTYDIKLTPNEFTRIVVQLRAVGDNEIVSEWTVEIYV